MGDVRGIVLPHQDDHWNGQQNWCVLSLLFVCLSHGGHWGDTEQVVVQWGRPEASVIPGHAALVNAMCIA